MNFFDKDGRLIYSAPAIALDGRVTVGISKACVACAEPVAHDGADSALAVVIDDGRVFNRHLITPGQIVQHRQTCNDLTVLHIQSQQLDGVSIVGEHHKIRRQRRRAAAAVIGELAAHGADTENGTLTLNFDDASVRVTAEDEHTVKLSAQAKTPRDAEDALRYAEKGIMESVHDV